MLTHEIHGQGPDLVMVHGWGMHAGIWSDWADSLAEDFRVHLLELPGHGRSDDSAGVGLDDWSAALAGCVPGRAWWLGWSLGALVCMNIARLYPQQVRGLVLVAGTPRFVRGPEWPCAVDGAVFDQFSVQLQEDLQRTLARFLSLQMRSAEGGTEGLRRLRTLLGLRPLARPGALRDGLALLQHSDLRAALEDLACPLHWLLGERDTLVPAEAGRRLPGSCEIVAGAGHAPFLSHPRLCSERIRGWFGTADEQERHAAV